MSNEDEIKDLEFEVECLITQMENNPDLSFSNASQNVASKGGTTEAGLNFLRNQNLLQSVISGAIDEAITKAEGCNQ